MIIRGVLVYLILLFPSIVLGQAITGSIIDEWTGEPLSDVNIDIVDTPEGAFTDPEGRFAISGLVPGAYRLRVSCIGYELLERTVAVSDRMPVVIEISMRPTVLRLNEALVITARRYEIGEFDVPEAVSILRRDQVLRDSPRSTPEALMSKTGVWMQKTNHGGGSPFIRGLTGNQTLLMIDGIRLNNATYRYGPNQYLNTVDPACIGQVEVIRGSGSVQYGSDALGGVVNIRTKNPRFTDRGICAAGNLFLKYMSDEMEKSARAELEIGAPALAFLGGVTVHNFGDIKAGGDLGTESPSGYDEFSGDVKCLFRPGSRNQLTLSYQHLYQDGVPRYDQVAQRGYETYSFDPQIRQLGYLRLESFFDSRWLRNLRISGSMNRSIEQRVKQKEGETVIVRERDEVDTWGMTIEIHSRGVEKWRIASGAEYYHDRVHSWKKETDTQTQVEIRERGLYPDGATSSSVALFALNSLDFNRLHLSLGGRVNAFTVSSSDNEFGDLNIDPKAFVGNVSALYAMHPDHHLSLSVDSGFRAPNINDMSSFGSFDFGIEVPSDDLSPEKALSVEAGLKSRTERTSASVALYRTLLFDLIDRVPSTYQGSDMYNGERVYTKENVGKAYVQGVEAELEYRLTPELAAFGSLVYTYGQNSSEDEPLRRIPPLNGRAGIRFQDKDGLWSELEWAGAAAQDRLAAGDVDDHRIPEGGTPGWNVVTVKGGFSWHGLDLSMGLQNLFDEAYRIHGSGVDGYGRSWWLALRAGM